MKAIFYNTVSSLTELKELTKAAKGKKRSEYIVTRKVVLNNKEFDKFTNNMLQDQEWIEDGEGGTDENGNFKCIEVVSKKIGTVILINPDGEHFAKYSAIKQKMDIHGAKNK